MKAYIFGTFLASLFFSIPFILVSGLIIGLFTLHRRKSFPWLWMLALTGLIITFVNIFSNTVSLTPFLSGFQLYGSINLVPFISIVKMVKDILSADPSRYSFVNFFGNIGFFIPLGFFVPLLTRKLASGWKVLLFGCLVSILIEVWQLFIPARGTDIDDVILNTLGTAIGYFCFWLLTKLFPKIYRHLYR